MTLVNCVIGIFVAQINCVKGMEKQKTGKSYALCDSHCMELFF